jgi:hypothetical protein
MKYSKQQQQTYKAWVSMRRRCNDTKSKCYTNYGARGIRVCDEWNSSFEAFYRDVGDKPDASLTLDRIDNDRGYEPGNVRWATRAEQNRNRRPRSQWKPTRPHGRRTDVLLTFKGKTMTMTDWAREVGIRRSSLWMRISQRGWSVERALTEPMQKRCTG